MSGVEVHKANHVPPTRHSNAGSSAGSTRPINEAFIAIGTVGVLHPHTVEDARIAGLKALDFLTRHDAYHFHQAAGSLIKTGPTMTNVMDVVLLLAL